MRVERVVAATQAGTLTGAAAVTPDTDPIPRSRQSGWDEDQEAHWEWQILKVIALGHDMHMAVQSTHEVRVARCAMCGGEMRMARSSEMEACLSDSLWLPCRGAPVV